MCVYVCVEKGSGLSLAASQPQTAIPPPFPSSHAVPSAAVSPTSPLPCPICNVNRRIFLVGQGLVYRLGADSCRRHPGGWGFALCSLPRGELHLVWLQPPGRPGGGDFGAEGERERPRPGERGVVVWVCWQPTVLAVCIFLFWCLLEGVTGRWGEMPFLVRHGGQDVAEIWTTISHGGGRGLPRRRLPRQGRGIPVRPAAVSASKADSNRVCFYTDAVRVAVDVVKLRHRWR